MIPLLFLAGLDLDFSRPEPEKSDPTKEIERDRRLPDPDRIKSDQEGRESTARRKEVGNRINS
jgi:hypothetical protein